MQAIGDDPLVALRIARHQPGAGLREDDGVDLDLLAGAARGVGDQIGRGADGGGERRGNGDAPAGRYRRLGHRPVDPEDRHVRLRRRVVGAGAHGGAGAEHESGALGLLQQRPAGARPDLVGEPALVDRVREQRCLNHVAHRNAGIDLGVQLVEQIDQPRHRVDHDQLAGSAAHRPLLRAPAPSLSDDGAAGKRARQTHARQTTGYCGSS